VLTDRLNLELTYYDKRSQDVLLQRQLAPSLGFQENPFVNIGEVRNSGLEVALVGQLSACGTPGGRAACRSTRSTAGSPTSARSTASRSRPSAR
jgi:hypothetical protein